MVCVEEKRSFQMHSLNFWLINLNALVVKIGRKSNRELNISKTKASCSSLDHVSVTRYFCLISTEFSFSMIHSGEAALYQEISTITLTDRSLFLISYRNLAVTMGS